MGAPLLLSDCQALLHDALRDRAEVSIANTPLHASSQENLGEHQGNPEFKPIVDGIHFNLRFILTYQLVLLALLLVFTIRHWGGRWKAWRRRRRPAERRRHESGGDTKTEALRYDIQARGSGSSSSSGTIEGDATPPCSKDVDIGEGTPLLQHSRSIEPRIQRCLLTSKIKACLVYQPRPIPIINKNLPSNGTTLAVTAFLGLQIFYLFFKMPLLPRMLFVFADRASLLFVANLPLLYLFAAKNQPIKILTGYSYESLNIIHRSLGEAMCLLALLHSAGMLGVWYTILKPVGVSLVKFLLIRMILLGSAAFIAYELIYLTSLGSFRKRWYELFLGTHVVLQAAAMILVWFHHRRSRWYVGIALAFFLIDRCVYRILLKSATLRALLEVKDDRKTVVVRTSIRVSQHDQFAKRFFGSNVTSGWKPTEHVFLTVPSLAHKHIIQAHPFTIASKAPSFEGEEANLELLIRAQDGFSGELVRHALNNYQVAIRLDGPYGSQSAVRMLQESDHAIIVAGGSGVAVAWPLLWAVLNDRDEIDLESSREAKWEKQMTFVWIVRDRSNLSWLGPQNLKQLEGRGVRINIPPPTAEYGHPDIEGTMEKLVAPSNNHTRRASNYGVVASGPDSLNCAVRNTCASLIRQGHDVDVEIEKFGW
ncbi:hypothetical protein MMC21_004413 [Puttea exsequens]|nr:hypothetical protein [Puttea exsequens]